MTGVPTKDQAKVMAMVRLLRELVREVETVRDMVAAPNTTATAVQLVDARLDFLRSRLNSELAKLDGQGLDKL